MKKLAIIGIVFASVLLWAATAQAKPTGMSQAEYRALISKIDKAAEHGALHRNNAARKKARAARIRARSS